VYAVISAGFLIGLLGSFHCVGMCGPIALSLPVHQHTSVRKIISILSYNIGRVFTYSILGLLFGVIGQSLFIGKYQQIISIVLGSLILIGLILPKVFSFIGQNTMLQKFQSFIQQNISKLFKQDKNYSTLFLIGLLNGLLPCGLVYMAISGALIAGNVFNSVLFMLFFGLATIPIMFSVAYFGNYISTKFRSKIRSAVPLIIGCMAVLLIVRGLNLGIPYISPEIKQTATGTQSCCHKK
jgi:sulfite exporter TauE/SafE